MKGRKGIILTIIWNIIIGFIGSIIVITAFISNDKLIGIRWIGIAIIIGTIYACIRWFKNEIDYLKSEIKKIKENVNRKEITK